jgi:hypothetical protein
VPSFVLPYLPVGSTAGSTNQEPATRPSCVLAVPLGPYPVGHLRLGRRAVDRDAGQTGAVGLDHVQPGCEQDLLPVGRPNRELAERPGQTMRVGAIGAHHVQRVPRADVACGEAVIGLGVEAVVPHRREDDLSTIGRPGGPSRTRSSSGPRSGIHSQRWCSPPRCRR